MPLKRHGPTGISHQDFRLLIVTDDPLDGAFGTASAGVEREVIGTDRGEL